MKPKRLHFLFQTEEESRGSLTARVTHRSVFGFGEIKNSDTRIWGKEGNPPSQNI